MAKHADAAAQLGPPEDSPPAPTPPPDDVPGSAAEKVEADAATSAPSDAADDATEVRSADDAADANDDDADANDDGTAPASRHKRWTPQRLSALVGVTAAVALVALSGWIGLRIYQLRQAEHQDQLFVQVARQGAVNLTTIDWQHADADVQRIVDSATGTFHDDFSLRSQPFVDAVKKVRSKSIGTVVEAGLESRTADRAEVLVAVSVKTAMANQPDQQARSWRMRITVQQVGNDQAKVSKVAFVP